MNVETRNWPAKPSGSFEDDIVLASIRALRLSCSESDSLRHNGPLDEYWQKVYGQKKTEISKVSDSMRFEGWSDLGPLSLQAIPQSGDSLEPNYSELLLREYQELQGLYEGQERGENNEDEIKRSLTRISEMEHLEGEQVERILTARLHMPFGQEAKLQQTTDALLRRYGSASRHS